MRKQLTLILFILISMTTVSTLNAATPSGDEIVKRVQEAYNQLKSLQCDFHQEANMKVNNQQATNNGTMVLMNDNRYRLETDAVLFVSDGKDVWTYNKKGTPPAIIVQSIEKAGAGMVPREMLFEFPKNFNVASVEEGTLDGRADYILQLTPKTPDVAIRHLKVWVDEKDSLTRKMEFEDTSGNKIVFTLSNVKLNAEIADSLFQFKAPEGVKVFDMR